LVQNAAGTLFGTTVGGGKKCLLRKFDHNVCGTVFKLNKVGKETVLYRFTGAPDGGWPYSRLVRDAAGNLYGTTAYAGDSSCSHGCGIVFKVDSTGKETVLYSFTGRPDGANPYAGLVRDAAGNLYGTALGGRRGFGVVFNVDSTGKETVQYGFTGSEGDDPLGGLFRDGAGNLYGTTVTGGTGCAHYACGTVFKLSKTGKETVLYSFTGPPDGANPYSGLVRDAAGSVYGTTVNGGTGTECGGSCGTVFKVDSAGKETVLHSFTGGTDGAGPLAGVVLDAQGNLYGTTYYGGSGKCNDGVGVGCGTVFKVDSTGKETVLYNFTGGSDGAGPRAGLLRDSAGNLYGTAFIAGAFGGGVVFKLTP
jgi:uncharacterized repeat protein (TIGR03803 family)